MKKLTFLLTICAVFFFSACQQDASKETSNDTDVKETYQPGDLPSWAINATIYEVNLRQGRQVSVNF